jgi:hypothetical protein
VRAGGVVRKSEFEVFLFSGREPFGRAGRLGIVWQNEEDDAGEEDGEKALEQVDPEKRLTCFQEGEYAEGTGM